MGATNRMMPPGEPRLSSSIKDLAAKAKQAAVKAQGTVLKAVDKNGNGKIDAEDFGITKESIQDAAQKLKASANRIGESLNDAKTELDRRVLRPVFQRGLVLGRWTAFAQILRICTLQWTLWPLKSALIMSLKHTKKASTYMEYAL